MGAIFALHCLLFPRAHTKKEKKSKTKIGGGTPLQK